MKLIGLRENSWRFLPALILGIIIWVLFKGLDFKQQDPTPQISDFPFPEFSLEDVRTKQIVTLDDLKGQLYIAHVWASWCRICINEHDVLTQIKNKWPYNLLGIVYRDNPDKALSILANKGDPYEYLLNDQAGQLGLSLGLTGTPETFIVDSQGVIRYHHLGALTFLQFENQILPILEQINHE